MNFLCPFSSVEEDEHWFWEEHTVSVFERPLAAAGIASASCFWAAHSRRHRRPRWNQVSPYSLSSRTQESSTAGLLGTECSADTLNIGYVLNVAVETRLVVKTRGRERESCHVICCLSQEQCLVKNNAESDTKEMVRSFSSWASFTWPSV